MFFVNGDVKGTLAKMPLQQRALPFKIII